MDLPSNCNAALEADYKLVKVLDTSERNDRCVTHIDQD